MTAPEDPTAGDATADDATVVRAAPGSAPGSAPHPGPAVTTSGSGSVALPVEDPEVSARSLGTGTLPGLDPERRIGPVPGALPWEVGPEPERGVRPGAPVVYGARSEFAGARGPGVDEVHRLFGDPPPARPVPPREGRAALPSVERRTRRIRLLTLIGFVGVLVVAVAGLWGVAVLAFG